MTNDELKKKIVEILLNVEWAGCLGYTYHLIGGMSAANAIADALIEAGIGDVNKFADTLPSKIPCHSYYYGDSIVCAIYALKQGVEIKDVKPVNISEFLVDELRRKLKEAEHRAERAERALKDCIDYYSYSGLCPVLDCNYNKACWRKECTPDIEKCFMIQAEKELTEEKKDEN